MTPNGGSCLGTVPEFKPIVFDVDLGTEVGVDSPERQDLCAKTSDNAPSGSCLDNAHIYKPK